MDSKPDLSTFFHINFYIIYIIITKYCSSQYDIKYIKNNIK